MTTHHARGSTWHGVALALICCLLGIAGMAHASVTLPRHNLSCFTPTHWAGAFTMATQLPLAQRVELFRRHIARVDEPRVLHLLEHFAITIHALHLIERAFVEIEAQPRHAFENGIDGFAGRALDVGVLDPQHEGPFHLARERPRIKRGANVAEVDEAGGTRCETGANRGGH